jgi:hypothetical protein
MDCFFYRFSQKGFKKVTLQRHSRLKRPNGIKEYLITLFKAELKLKVIKVSYDEFIEMAYSKN